MNRHKTDEVLDTALKRWRLDETLPPRFEERVWKRIANAQARRPSVWQTFIQEVMAGLARPAPAAIYLAILLFTGLVGGYYHAHAAENHTLQELSNRYVQMVDPYQTRH